MTSTTGGWGREIKDFARAFSGAYIFGIPLLFTMEMWWLGEYAALWKLLAFLLVALAANFGFSYAAGFKRETSLGSALQQAVEALAVGIVAATVMLLVLNRIQPGDPLDTIAGTIVIQAVPLSIGASVANEIFGRRGERQRQAEDHGNSNEAGLKPWQELFSDLGATVIGGIFVGFSIAPTEEIPMLAAELDFGHLLALIGLSLLVSYASVFASGFDGAIPEGPFQKPLTETTLAYVVSLLVAGASLYFFNQIEPGDSLRAVVAQTLVLGLPTTIGGAAGRLVI